jgi:ribonucleotide reductase alpha subunit
VEEAFRLAFESGIKGVTVYRNNSRCDQPLLLAAESPSADPVQCLECD